MEKPPALSADQIAIVDRAALPLHWAVQLRFRERVLELLSLQPVLGDGITHRIVRQVQSEFFDPPDTPEYHAPRGLRKFERRAG